MSAPVALPTESERFISYAVTLANVLYVCTQQLNTAGHKTVDLNLIIVARTFIERQNPDTAIIAFIDRSNGLCWDKIHEKDEHYFVEHANEIFNFLPMDTISIFRDLFLAVDANRIPIVPQDLKDKIWTLLASMVKTSIKYIHKRRQPYSYMIEDILHYDYAADFYNEIDLPHHITLWNPNGIEWPLKTN